MRTADAIARALVQIVGFAWIALVVQLLGCGILALVVGGFRTRHGAGGPKLWTLIALSALVGPLGAIFVVGPVLSLWEQLGPWKAVACEALVIAAIGTFVAPLFRRFLQDDKPARTILRPMLPTGTCDTPTPWSTRTVAAACNLVVVAGCGAAYFGRNLLWFDADSAGAVMGAEFLVIHMGFFLGFVFVVRPQTWPGRGLQWFLFVSMLSFYVHATLGRDWADTLPYLSAALGTYGGFLLNRSRSDALLQLVKRWGVSFALFIVLALSFRMDETVNHWRSEQRTLLLASLYFALLGAAEAVGVYGRRWRLPWKRPTGAPSRRGD